MRAQARLTQIAANDPVRDEAVDGGTLTLDLIIVVTVVAYIILMVAIGAYMSKRNLSTKDFYLGGRQLGPFVTAMSAEASDMSSYLLMGVPGVALAGLVGMNGSFAEAIWTVAGLAIGTYINWLLVAKRLRIYSEEVEAHTVPGFFALYRPRLH